MVRFLEKCKIFTKTKWLGAFFGIFANFFPSPLPNLEMSRSSEENEYLASISVGLLQLFRKSVSSHLLSHEIIINQALQKIYTEDYLKLNAAKFLDNDWVNVDDLRRFIASKSALETHQRPVKHEADLCESLIPVKRERKASPGLSQSFKNSGTFRTTVQSGKEVIEIFSSDEDNHPPKKFLKKKSGTAELTTQGRVWPAEGECGQPKASVLSRGRVWPVEYECGRHLPLWQCRK